jgi:ATP-dependent Lhr-like helicase
VLRRLEARGEVRGGRFVASFTGEQFALPEAVEKLRATRRLEPAGELVRISAADPANLVGIVMPGERVPAFTRNRVLFQDGVPVAALDGKTAKRLQPDVGDDVLEALTKPALKVLRRSSAA